MSNLTPSQMAAAMLQAQQSGQQDPVFTALASIPDNPAIRRLDEIGAAKGQTAEAFGGLQPRTLIPLFDGIQVPFKGMFSALAPYVLQPGQFSLCQNLRADDGSLVSRLPTTDQSATGLGSAKANSNFSALGSPRGLWSGSLNGTVYVIGVWFVGTSGTNANGVGLFTSTDGIAFTEATATSGPFGNSRMTDTGLPFAFQVVTNKTDNLDYLVVQNGVDAPRVYSVAGFYGANVRVINQFSPPLWASSTNVLGACNVAYSSRLAPGSVTSTSGAGHLVPSIIGSAPTQQVQIIVGASTVASDNILYDFGTDGLAFSFGRQLLFISDQASLNLWDSWKLEVSSDNITYYPLSDPTASNYYAPTRVPFSDPAFLGTGISGGLGGEEVVAFDVSVLTPSITNTFQYLKMTWVGTTVPATAPVTTTIHGILASGAEPAFGQIFTLSYSGLNGMSESPGVVMAGFSNRTTSQIPGLPGVYVPYVAGVFYDYFIPTQVQSSADLNNGCDTINVYRQDLGATDAFFFISSPFGIYSGGNWVYPGSGTTTPPPFTSSISITYALYGSVALDVSRFAPSAYCMVMPIGLALAYGNARLFVGGQSYYAVSESLQPFRFAPAPDPLTSRAATYIQIPGETVNSFAVTSSGSLSANTVWMFTQVKTRMLAGFDGFSLSQPQADFDIGCSMPASVDAYKDAIFWGDDNLQMRRFSYGRAALYGYSGSYGYDLAPAISKRVVSDRTTTIPVVSLPWVCGLATFDRYYFFYTPAGQTVNNRCLVFDETIGCFVEDTLSVGAQSAVVANLASGRQILFQGSDSHVYRHENSTSTTSHAVALTTRELSDGMWNPTFFGRVGVTIDAQSGQTMSLTKTLKPTGATDASTIDLATLPVNASAAPQMWRWDSRATSTQPGLNGVSSQIAMTWTMRPGTRLYSIVQEVQKTIAGADQT